jgi:hypothetical protein
MTRSIHEDATTQIFNETEEVVSIRGGRIEVPDEGTQLQIGEKPLVIGRSRRCDLVLDDKTVTALHMEVQATPKGVRVLDLKSRNGSFLHDARFTEVYLNGTWELRCGAKRLRFVADPPHDVIVRQQHRFGDLIGTTPEMLQALRPPCASLAPSAVSIVIRGETGTGKERVAKRDSRREPAPGQTLSRHQLRHRGRARSSNRSSSARARSVHRSRTRTQRALCRGPRRDALLRRSRGDEPRPCRRSSCARSKTERCARSEAIHTRKVDVRTLFASHTRPEPRPQPRGGSARICIHRFVQADRGTSPTARSAGRPHAS